MKVDSLNLIAVLSLSLFLIIKPDFSKLDGIIDEDEISIFDEEINFHSQTIFFSKKDNLLRISIDSEKIYVANICIAYKNRIDVFHASAALGKVSYQKNKDLWITEEEFDWELRESTVTEETIELRKKYFLANNWVATTMSMGEEGETEFYFNTSNYEASQPIYIAAGLMPASNPDSIIGFPENSASFCADQSLVSGDMKNKYPFEVKNWFPLEL